MVVAHNHYKDPRKIQTVSVLESRVPSFIIFASSKTMAKNRNRGQRRGQGQHNKRQKHQVSSQDQKSRGRYWIQDCPDLLLPPTDTDRGDIATTIIHNNNNHKNDDCLLVWLTESRLQDSHPSFQSQSIPLSTNIPVAATPSPPDPTSPNAHYRYSARRVTDTDTQSTTTTTDNPFENKYSQPNPTHNASDGPHIEDTTSPGVEFKKGTNSDDANGTLTSTCLLPQIFIQRVVRPQNDGTKLKKKLFYQPLPNGDCGDGIVNPNNKTDVPDKYWAQRHRLFTKFDEGIQLDRDGWFSVTPEVIAHHIAQHLVLSHRENITVGSKRHDSNQIMDMDTAGNNSIGECSYSSGSIRKTNGLVVLDALAGVGGNSIAFCQHPGVALVLCVDTSLDRLRIAANNCQVYDIPSSKIRFIHGDALQVLERYNNGVCTVARESSLPLPSIAAVHASSAANSTTETDVKSEGCVSSSVYTFEGYESLPERLDAIFLSPPWGGVDYEEIGRRHYNLRYIELEGIEAGSSNKKPGCMRTVEEKTNAATAAVTTILSGVDLLRMSLVALPANRPKIACYLPRNLNGLTLAQDCHKCGVRGEVEMEQNIVNGKLKTITVYINSGCSSESVSSDGDRQVATTARDVGVAFN